MEPIIKESGPLVVVVGETASGKSALAMRLAERFSGELISADSWAVYESFDIGTAKPGAQDYSRVQHHLISVVNPIEGFNAAVYKRLAARAIDDITARGNLPILVGGTGLYVDSVLYDYSFLPGSDPKMRVLLNAKDLNYLKSKILEAGIDTTGIDMRNKRRLVRLLESGGSLPAKSELRDNTIILGIKTQREELRERITRRVDRMFDEGLKNEVAGLQKEYGWDIEPMKGIGYREFFEYFNGTQTIEETKARIISATLNLAKKQRTWFKRNKSIHWIDNWDEAVDLVTTFLNK